MSASTAEPPRGIETWTKEDVRRWLMREVKVHQSCADTFIEEEVSGEVLADFEKKDILDLGIKHGPAVKITCYLERLKEGAQHESHFPGDVETWTKERVGEWLLQRVKVDGDKAARFQEEDVSGDCLVCFKKQDFLDLELKKGPAVKILKELGRLESKEPALRPVFRSIRLSFRAKKPPEDKTTNLPPEKDQRPTSQTKATNNAAPLIKNTLDKLGAKDLKSFHFELRHHIHLQHKPIARSKLEDKDTMDVATLLTDYYGGEDALCVTRDILRKIHQRDLASKLENHAGVVKFHHKCGADGEDTAKSDSPSCSRCKHEKTEEKNASCFMNVKINLPSCLN